MSYTKLFSSIVASTIWQESKDTKILWVTMLAVKNQYGIVEASVPGLAKFAGLTIPECQESLTQLQAPDPYSRTKTDEGRRVEECEGGWRVINHMKYRDMEGVDDRREQLRLAQARFRVKHAPKARKLRKPKITANGFTPPRIAPPEEDHNRSYDQYQKDPREERRSAHG